MRSGLLTASAAAAIFMATPATAFDGADARLASSFAIEAPVARANDFPRRGRTIAAFALDEQTVTLSAFGRRARARSLGNEADIRHARAMGKVFDGAPQPALFTVELSLKF